MSTRSNNNNNNNGNANITSQLGNIISLPTASTPIHNQGVFTHQITINSNNNPRHNPTISAGNPNNNTRKSSVHSSLQPSQPTSTSSSRRQTPDRGRGGMTPSSLKPAGQLQNQSLNTQNDTPSRLPTGQEELEDPATLHFKRKMKLSLIRNVYTRKNNNSNNNSGSNTNQHSNYTNNFNWVQQQQQQQQQQLQLQQQQQQFNNNVQNNYNHNVSNGLGNNPSSGQTPLKYESDRRRQSQEGYYPSRNNQQTQAIQFQLQQQQQQQQSPFYKRGSNNNTSIGTPMNSNINNNNPQQLQVYQQQQQQQQTQLYQQQQQNSRLNRSLNVSHNTSFTDCKDIVVQVPNRRHRGDASLNAADASSFIQQPTPLSLYRKVSPFDLNKILPNSNTNNNNNNNNNNTNHLLNNTINDDTLNSQLEATVSIAASRRTPSISKAYTYNPKRNNNNTINSIGLSSTEKSDVTSQLMAKGQKLFKDNDLAAAAKCFSDCLKLQQQQPSQNSSELHYLLSLCYIGQSQYRLATEELQYVIFKDNTYNHNVYLLLSLSLKKQGNIEGAIKALSDGIALFNNFTEAYLARAKLFLKIGQPTDAIKDLHRVLSFNDNPEAHLMLGDAMKKIIVLGKNNNNINNSSCDSKRSKTSSNKSIGKDEQQINYYEVIEAYKKAMQSTERIVSETEQNNLMKTKAILRIADTLITIEQYQESLEFLKKLNGEEDRNSEALLIRGLAEKGLNKWSDADLSFEGAVQRNENSKVSLRALEEMAILKIHKRDYYQALHTLSRAEFIESNSNPNTTNANKISTSTKYSTKQKKITNLERLRVLTESVILLMKRKFQEAVEKFSQLENQLDEFTYPLFYAYRAYGLFCLGRHAEAQADYVKLPGKNIDQKEQISSDTGSCVNLTISQSDQGIKYNSLLCRGILSYKQLKFEQALKLFSAAEQIYSTKVEPYLYRCACWLQLGLQGNNNHSHSNSAQQHLNPSILKGISCLNQAIQHSKDVSCSVYYFRGVLNVQQQQFRDALSDIDKAIEKSEDNVCGYFYLRGLAFACTQHYSQAIQDLTIAIQLNESMHEAFLLRAQCAHYSGDSSSAFADLQKYIALRPTDPSIHLLAGNLLFNNCAYEDAIRAYSHSDQIGTNGKLLMLRTKCNLLLRNIPEAYQDINKLVELNPQSRRLAFDKGCLTGLFTAFQAISKQSQIQQPLIQQQSSLQQQQQSYSLNEYYMDIQKSLNQLQKLHQNSNSSSREGEIFKEHDLVLIIGVLNVACGYYEQGIVNLSKSVECRQAFRVTKRLGIRRQSVSSGVGSDEDDDNDGYDEGNDPKEIEENQAREYQQFATQANINIAITNILAGDYEASSECCEKMLNGGALSEEEIECVGLIRETVELLQGEQQSEQDQELCAEKIEKLSQMLGDCSLLADLNVGGGSNNNSINGKINGNNNVNQQLNQKQKRQQHQSSSQLLLKLSLNVPYIKPPSFHPKFNYQLLHDLTVDVVENKPEAPWIKRNDNGVVFTDNLQPFDEDIDDDEDNGNNNKDEQDRMIEIDRMKAKLMLDKNIENKLKKMKKLEGGKKEEKKDKDKEEQVEQSQKQQIKQSSQVQQIQQTKQSQQQSNQRQQQQQQQNLDKKESVTNNEDKKIVIINSKMNSIIQKQQQQLLKQQQGPVVPLIQP